MWFSGVSKNNTAPIEESLHGTALRRLSSCSTFESGENSESVALNMDWTADECAKWIISPGQRS